MKETNEEIYDRGYNNGIEQGFDDGYEQGQEAADDDAYDRGVRDGVLDGREQVVQWIEQYHGLILEYYDGTKWKAQKKEWGL